MKKCKRNTLIVFTFACLSSFSTASFVNNNIAQAEAFNFVASSKTPMPTDSRIKTFAYNPNEIFQVKFMVGYQFFFNKVYVYKNYIKYMTDGFELVLDTLNMYMKSSYILASEKYFLQLFKDKVMKQLRKVIEDIK